MEFPHIKANARSLRQRKPLLGVGINDADHIVRLLVSGEWITSPFYKTWADMLKRCYSTQYQESWPTYVGCTVCDEWLLFSNFRSWMLDQDWRGHDLDKDLKVPGNKIYGPDTCLFIPQGANKLFTDHGASRGDYPLGVYLSSGRYKAQCSVNGKQRAIGRFDTPEEAHAAYLDFKIKHCLEVARKYPQPLRAYIETNAMALREA